MMRLLLLAVFTGVLFSSSISAAEPIAVPADQLNQRYQLVGKLHRPLGEVLSVEGFIVPGEFKGYESNTQLRVTRIGDQPIQEDIQISLANLTPAIRGQRKPDAKLGTHYRFRGYETGGFVGHPPKLWDPMEWLS
jgi:hypothetical protein